MHLLIATAKQLTKEQTRALTTALECIPQEHRYWAPGGCAKTAMEIYLQCAGEYSNMANFLRGKTLLSWDIVLQEATKHLSYDEAVTLMEKNEIEFLSALDEIGEARLHEMIELPWGEKTTRGHFIFLTSHHIAYHCGQLNYIQTILGDAEIH
jgi:hypothetical protein